MSNWDYRINIKKHFDQCFELGQDDAIPSEVKTGIIRELRSIFNEGVDFELDMIIESLESCVCIFSANDVLTDLYDWADRKRVWLGL